ncbi:type II and III secretion system protein family protein [Novosphingobium sp. 1949]|uniref:Type II and III secretion system protein family protein n=1 Tax=Novosphingobium organovorum TaxID=2930092 RepID=A0ABT0BB90_9SPHN|nr:type II and III secretion system protein family protein [Novosphingobium organovorum]MCJ2182329.1 type II and III secretion system protein family protein [Novosphingobium organovorum]
MTRRLLPSLLGAACALIPAAALLTAAAASPAQAQTVVRPAQDISLSIGNGQLVTLPARMADVFVANDSVADVQVKSTSQLYVFGKAGGTTTVYASDKAGKVIWSANIRVGSNFDSVDSMLKLAMPEAHITVSTMGTSTFLLTGTIKAPEDAAEAERLVQAYVGKDANVISRLRTATPLQVNLQVRIAEVSRSLVKSLGVNLSSIDNTNGFKFGVGQGSATGLATSGSLGVGATGTGTSVSAYSSGTTLAGAGKLFGMNILAALDAGETVGLVTSLAQPNLTALSGETAEFLAGGEYPIPISQGSSGSTTVTIEYKQYGVSLSYTPTVLSNGRISLRVRPEVSELSSDGAVTLNGYEVPALTTRRTETTVELGSGQSFMIAGLLSNNTSNSIQKMPGAGDLPILGSLFRSTSYKRGETELVIVITPYLVSPVDASQIALPTDGFNSPNELQRILANQSSDGKDGQKRPAPTRAPATTAPAAPTGATGQATSADDTAAQPGFNLN